MPPLPTTTTMSLVPLTVELPQYAKTFNVNVPQEGFIRDVKNAVSKACPGRPSVDGQRLICKGRVLGDGEALEQLWKPDEPRVVHLAVNPSSWLEGPPETAVSDSKQPLEDVARALLDTMGDTNLQDNERTSYLRRRHPRAPIPTRTYRSSSAPHQYLDSLQYIAYIHFKALKTLSSSFQVPLHASSETPGSKDFAKHIILSSGRNWPSIFDEEFPPSTGVPSAQGVDYSFSIIDGKPYLQLITPDATPSTIQQHAIRVLSYTFPLLSVRAPGSGLPNATPHTNANNVNQPAVQIRALPVRALLAPLILLCLRTLLLLYFFSPAKKPLFSILLGAWVLYEAWGAVRGAIVDLNEIGRDDNNQPAGQNGNGNGNGNADAPRAPAANMPIAARAGARPRPGQNGETNTSDIVLSRLARLNLQADEQALAAAGAPEPGFFSKMQSFISLFVLTIHPAVWNRRRAALQQREGRMRGEIIRRRVPQGDIQDATPPEIVAERQRLEEMHQRRGRWVREYIERVDQDEWVDE